MDARAAGKTRDALKRLLALAALLCGAAAHAGSLTLCSSEPELNAGQQDALLRFADVIARELDASGREVALIARAGLDLARIGQRYSHAGFSLKASANGAWSVRQLYFDCNEQRPRLFDQGLAGFLYGARDPERGFVSVVLLPAERTEALAVAALDAPRSLSLLSAQYSANAYAWGLDYQNCNQWVAEMLGLSFGASDSRAAAQVWLRDAGYVPSLVKAGFWLTLAAYFVPHAHNADHPREDLELNQYRVSLPVAIEDFAHLLAPEAERIEFCLAPGRVVVHRGWTALADDCTAGPADRLVTLD
ncbi:MAG TPA: DUF2145 domain-containing protein [Burkholderiaceae bacterium]